MLRVFHNLEVIFESGGRHAGVYERRQRAEVRLIVDFAAVHFGDEGAKHFPGDFGGGDVGAALGDDVDPCVDDVAAAFVLRLR